jgi:NAD(P)-dependent dehydrogenase (short-subunit alcohol dehydrogenase family)
MGRVNGKEAFITGAGRGQGREHAVRLANDNRVRHLRRHRHGGVPPSEQKRISMRRPDW